MKIHEIIIESSVDEGVGSIIGKAASGIGKAVGGLKGGIQATGSAVKAGYKAGEKAAQRSIFPTGYPDNNGNQSTTTQQPGGQATQAPGQQQSPGVTGTNPPVANQQQTALGQQPASAPAAQPAQQATAPAAAPMKADDIVKDLDDAWSKATADQGSETTSGKVQQQIRAMAKAAGMTGQTVESKKSKKSVAEFQSRFLGMKI